MIQRRKAVLAGVLGLAVAMLSGCYESTTPTMHEPGVYKGKQDPLRDKLKGNDLQAQLNDRFQRAAQDR